MRFSMALLAWLLLRFVLFACMTQCRALQRACARGVLGFEREGLGAELVEIVGRRRFLRHVGGVHTCFCPSETPPLLAILVPMEFPLRWIELA